MKKAIRFACLTAACLAAAFFAMPQSTNDSLDSLKACAATQKLIFENQFVRVIDDRIPVGVAEPQRAVDIAHHRQLYADQRDARHDDLALDEGLRGEVDVHLRRLGDDAALGVEDPRAQYDEVDPALIARPFPGRLVVFDRDARKGLGQGI